MHDVDAFLPHGCPPLHGAELPREERVEAVEVLLGPFDAGAGHHGGEALLVDADGVFDEGEIDVGDLENVEREVAFEDAATRRVSSWGTWKRSC